MRKMRGRYGNMSIYEGHTETWEANRIKLGTLVNMDMTAMYEQKLKFGAEKKWRESGLHVWQYERPR